MWGKMSSTILEALDKIANRPNCCGGSGTGPQLPGGADPADDPGPETGDPPSGFDSWSQFNDYKCRVANWIVDGLIQTFDIFESFSGSSGFVGVVAIVETARQAIMVAGTASAIGVGSIVAGLASQWYLIAAGLILLAATGIVAWAVFGNLVEAIETNREELVCSLKNSTPETVRPDFMDIMNDAMSGWATQGILADLVEYFLPNEVTNNLFVKNDDLTTYHKDTDCAACGNSCLPELYLGSFVSTGPGTFDLTTSGSATGYKLGVNFKSSGEWCGGNITSISILTGGLTGPGVQHYPYWTIIDDANVYHEYNLTNGGDSAFLADAVSLGIRQIILSYNSVPTTIRVNYA